jgi:hypothetical protein
VHAGEAVDLALGLGEHVFGRVGVLEFRPKLFEFRIFGLAFAELLLDRLDLLAEEVVALGLGDFGTDLLLDLGR